MGVVRLEVGGLVDDQRVGHGMGLGEAVGGELGDLVEEGRGLGPVDVAGGRPIDEARPLRGHHLGLLLAHGAPQEVRLA